MRFAFTPVVAAVAALAAALASSAWAQNPAWQKLFDGKDMSGWQYDSSYWSVDSGMLVGQGKSTFNTFCNVPRKYSDFVLSAWTRLWETPAGYTNSGIQYRSGWIDSASHRMQGYQWDVGEGYDGMMYPENAYPADARPLDIPYACRSTIKRNGWNHVLITASGGTVKHELNGVYCFEYAASVRDGYVGLQLHASSVVTKVDFRDIYIRPLNGAFAVPDSQSVYLKDDFTQARSAGAVISRNLRVTPGEAAGVAFFGAENRMLAWPAGTEPLSDRGGAADMLGRSVSWRMLPLPAARAPESGSRTGLR